MPTVKLVNTSKVVIQEDFVILQRMIDINIYDNPSTNMLIKKDGKRLVVMNSYQNKRLLNLEQKETNLYKLGLYKYVNSKTSFNSTAHYTREHFINNYKSLNNVDIQQKDKLYTSDNDIHFKARLRVYKLHETVNTHFDSFYFLNTDKNMVLKPKLREYCDGLKRKKLSSYLYCNFIFHTKHKIIEERFSNISIHMKRYNKKFLNNIFKKKAKKTITRIDKKFRRLLSAVQHRIADVNLRTMYELCILNKSRKSIIQSIDELAVTVQEENLPVQDIRDMQLLLSWAAALFIAWNILNHIYRLYKKRVFDFIWANSKI